VASKRFAVIVNPASGRRRGTRVLDEVRPIFDAAGAELDVSTCVEPKHAFRIAHSLNLRDYDGCCIIGGDGTIHEVVNGLLERDEPIAIPLGLIPAGSGNTLHLQQGGGNAVQAAGKIVGGQTCPLDVARVTMRETIAYCVNIVGWGSVSEINDLAERLRRLGPVRYAVASLRFILNPRPRLARLILDGRTCEDEFLFVIGCITKYTGNGMKLAPQAEIDDGKIDVVIVRPASRLELLRLLSRVFEGNHIALDCVEYHQVRQFAIELDQQEPLNLDGEAIGKAPFTVEMMPGALQIFV
jgi:YegS/Rv2252/BmrU family lipid kinase